jgi:hypothetical protein
MSLAQITAKVQDFLIISALHAAWRSKILYYRRNLNVRAVNSGKKLHFCSIDFEPGKRIEYPFEQNKKRPPDIRTTAWS